MKLGRERKPEETGRRVRPQTGQSRTFVSYHASRKSYEESRTPQRNTSTDRLPAPKRLNQKTLPVVFITVLLLLGLYYMTLLSTDPKMIFTDPSGVKNLRSSQTYQQATQELLNSSLANRNKLTINTEKLAQQLRERFPELNSATVVLPLFGHRPTVEVVSTRPALLLTNQSGVYVIDDNGKAVIAAKDVANSAGLPVPTIHDESNLQVQVGKGVLAKSDVTFITTLVQEFAFKKISLTSLTLPNAASELQVKIADQPYYIKFSLMTDPRVATGQYFVLRDKLAKDHVTPSEYVDSRVEEKIYYK